MKKEQQEVKQSHSTLPDKCLELQETSWIVSGQAFTQRSHKIQVYSPLRLIHILCLWFFLLKIPHNLPGSYARRAGLICILTLAWISGPPSWLVIEGTLWLIGGLEN